MSKLRVAAKVAVVMGSRSDWDTMIKACEALELFQLGYHTRVVSAHRTPKKMMDFATNAKEDGFKVIIAGAGGAAHLPGMIAACTSLPVLGVPVKSRMLSGWDSLLSIVQMPKGVAVGTLAIGDSGAFNAGLMAAQILALEDDNLAERLEAWRSEQTQTVLERDDPRST